MAGQRARARERNRARGRDERAGDADARGVRVRGRLFRRRPCARPWRFSSCCRARCLRRHRRVGLDHRNRVHRRRERRATGREPGRRHAASDARSRGHCANQSRTLRRERQPGRRRNRPRRRSHDALQINEAPEPVACESRRGVATTPASCILSPVPELSSNGDSSVMTKETQSQKELEEYVCGGYFIVRTANSSGPVEFCEICKAKLPPGDILTVSTCLTVTLPHNWAYQWVNVTDEERRRRAQVWG